MCQSGIRALKEICRSAHAHCAGVLSCEEAQTDLACGVRQVPTLQKKIVDQQSLIAQLGTRMNKLEDELQQARDRQQKGSSFPEAELLRKKTEDLQLLELQIDSLQAQLRDKDYFHTEAQNVGSIER